MKIGGQQISGLLQPAGRKGGAGEAKSLNGKGPAVTGEGPAAATGAPVPDRGADTVVFSARAREVQLARKLALEAPDVRPVKVDRIARLVAEGRYEIPEEDLAAAMLHQPKLK